MMICEKVNLKENPKWKCNPRMLPKSITFTESISIDEEFTTQIYRWLSATIEFPPSFYR